MQGKGSTPEVGGTVKVAGGMAAIRAAHEEAGVHPDDSKVCEPGLPTHLHRILWLTCEALWTKAPGLAGNTVVTMLVSMMSRLILILQGTGAVTVHGLLKSSEKDKS
jgi:hypothetical protein